MVIDASTCGLYVANVNSLLKSHGFNLTVSVSDFKFLESVVIADGFNEERRFSNLLTRSISPPIHSGEFYHYTSAIDAVLQSGTLRLTSLYKRIEEDEIENFLSDFGFKHPLSIDPDTGKPRYQDTISKEIFYTSFTDVTLSDTEEKYFWETFAGKNGARMRFKILLESGCLRKMVYGNAIQKSAAFFREISELTEKMLGKVFFWEDSATICALHLPLDYQIEKETRLITRRLSGLKIGNCNGFEFQEIEFGVDNPLKIRLELLEIQTDQIVKNSRGAIVKRRI